MDKAEKEYNAILYFHKWACYQVVMYSTVGTVSFQQETPMFPHTHSALCCFAAWASQFWLPPVVGPVKTFGKLYIFSTMVEQRNILFVESSKAEEG